LVTLIDFFMFLQVFCAGLIGRHTGMSFGRS
jgi:hypothetical protein